MLVHAMYYVGSRNVLCWYTRRLMLVLPIMMAFRVMVARGLIVKLVRNICLLRSYVVAQFGYK